MVPVCLNILHRFFLGEETAFFKLNYTFGFVSDQFIADSLIKIDGESLLDLLSRCI